MKLSEGSKKKGRLDAQYKKFLLEDLKNLVEKVPGLDFLKPRIESKKEWTSKEFISCYRLLCNALQEKINKNGEYIRQLEKEVEKKRDFLKQLEKDFEKFAILRPPNYEVHPSLTYESYERELSKKQQEISELYQDILEEREKYRKLQEEYEREKTNLLFGKNELIKAHEYLIMNFLPVLDDLERAIEVSKSSQNFEALFTGIEMVRRRIEEIFQKEGVERIQIEGRTFNPHFHEVLVEEETFEYPENTIIEELRKGYIYKSKVLRPALVKIAKAGRSQNITPKNP